VEYLKNKILILLFFLPLVSYGQWSYTFTDPCTLNQQTIQVAGNNSVALNYFGNVQTFSEDDFSNGVFDSWLDLVTQANTSNPCESVTQVIMNTTNSVVVQNTLTVVTNIMSILGGDMLPQAVSSSAIPVAEAIDNSAGEDEKGDNNSEPNNNSESGNNKEGKSGNNKEKNEDEEAEGTATISLANSISNSVDGGSAEANKNAGSLIASGDIVVIDNRDNSNGRQVKVVSSITHANTEQTRIKGALLTYTSVTNDFSLTFYKSWINPNKTFNLVGANTTMTDWNLNHLNTTTILESFKFGKKKYTGMAGANFTIGKLGKRDLQNISAVAGVHRNFKISEKISTSTLLLGVYSPFTQYYEGKWWDPGILIVPFSSWDIKITKTFKYNISFTGVWHSQGNALNFQVLTGGKIRF
jgi:hypothetical protein